LKLSRALTIAGHGMGVQTERLRTVARALAKEHRSAAQSAPRAGDGAPTIQDLRDLARHREASLLAMEAARRLLTRTIDMLK
jgi:flagellar basal body rod protein FlgC